jgi:hypothetical protein
MIDSDRIVESSVELSDSVLIEDEDIISYDPGLYTFKLKENIPVFSDPYKLHKLPVAITVDGKLIYTAYFWSMFSRGRCDWVTINYFKYKEYQEIAIIIEPVRKNADSIIDRRNTDEILTALRKNNKLGS